MDIGSFMLLMVVSRHRSEIWVFFFFFSCCGLLVVVVLMVVVAVVVVVWDILFYCSDYIILLC